jgi:hypothetical protein
MDCGLWCVWPERKTKQKSCEACAEAKAVCRMLGAPEKEPWKQRKVEGRVEGADKTWGKSRGKSEDVPTNDYLQRIVEGMIDMSNINEVMLKVFKAEMLQTRKVFSEKVDMLTRAMRLEL